MSSPLIQRIIALVIDALIRSERLVLVASASPEQLAAELTAALTSAPGFAQFGPWLSGCLLTSPLVDDLYASDAEISELLREVEP